MNADLGSLAFREGGQGRVGMVKEEAMASEESVRDRTNSSRGEVVGGLRAGCGAAPGGGEIARRLGQG
jgi:hypothetical protein